MNSCGRRSRGRIIRPAGVNVSADDLFISDGSKCDCGNMLDIFAAGGKNRVAVADPVYPVYVDTNVMAGNTGPADENGRYGDLVYLPATAENDFQPPLPEEAVDVIYLCYPNNPTGAVASKDYLAEWVAYAQRHDAVLLFDAAYESFITDPEVPHSIYEIPGAETCAVEFRSFSKNAGFTGVRCAFTVVPPGVTGTAPDGTRVPLRQLWNRRQSTKFNGVSYVVQRGGGGGVFGLRENSDRGLGEVLPRQRRGHSRRPDGRRSGRVRRRERPLRVGEKRLTGPTANPRAVGEFFDQLLREARVVCTPGAGFGAAGEGYVRLSAFNGRENVERAVERVCGVLG